MCAQLDLSVNSLCGINPYTGEGTYTAEGINAIADALSVNGALTSLDLERNNLNDDAKRALNEANEKRATPARVDL